MDNDFLPIVLDTNVIISALIFGGKPRVILELVLRKKLKGITSSPLLTELTEILIKKFRFSQKAATLTENKIKEDFEIVYPRKIIKILKDEPDNRVLEAALAGQAEFIVAGDKELLNLKFFRGVKILKPTDFLLNTKYNPTG